MHTRLFAITAASLLIALAPHTGCSQDVQNEPPVVSAPAGGVPSDAIVLFGGGSLAEWQFTDGGAVDWPIDNGAFSVQRGGGIVTKRSFGDFQLHLEFATPDPPSGEGQGRGNSGVYLHGRYEVQVLDSYNNPTYVDGMVGAIYQQYAPQVNASRRPGEWQTYDIIFHAPRFNEFDHVVKRATLTVLHNGVLIQDNVEINPTPGGISEDMVPEGPIYLQDHSNPVRYRNIWVREL